MVKSGKAIPEMSVDTTLLYQRIKTLARDEVVPYAELSKIIGREVTDKARANLQSARRRALKEDSIVTEAVFGVGIKRMTDVSIVEHTGDQVRRKIRRASKIAVKKLTCVEFDSLTNPQKIKHNAEVSQLSTVYAFSDNSTHKKITKKVEETNKTEPLAIAATIAAFGGK